MRDDFHESMVALEGDLQRGGELVVQGVRAAVVAIEEWDAGIVEHTRSLDAQVEALYWQIEQDVATLIATQAPVASDLRTLLAVLHVNGHLERMSRNCVKIARLLDPGLGPDDADLRETFATMTTRAAEMTRTALDALESRNLELAVSLPKLDEGVDLEHARVMKMILQAGQDRIEWGAQMLFVARAIERIADHAVKIAEQAAYVVTGEFRKLAREAAA